MVRIHDITGEARDAMEHRERLSSFRRLIGRKDDVGRFRHGWFLDYTVEEYFMGLSF